MNSLYDVNANRHDVKFERRSDHQQLNFFEVREDNSKHRVVQLLRLPLDTTLILGTELPIEHKLNIHLWNAYRTAARQTQVTLDEKCRREQHRDTC